MIRKVEFDLKVNPKNSELDQYIQDHPVHYTQKRKFTRTVMK